MTPVKYAGKLAVGLISVSVTMWYEEMAKGLVILAYVIVKGQTQLLTARRIKINVLISQ